MRLSQIRRTLKEEHGMDCVHITNEQHSNQRAIACSKEGVAEKTFKIAELPSSRYSSEAQEFDEEVEELR